MAVVGGGGGIPDEGPKTEQAGATGRPILLSGVDPSLPKVVVTFRPDHIFRRQF